MARVHAEGFVNEQSGIFEITALPLRPEPGRSGAIIGFVLVSMLFGTVTMLAYWHAVMP